jgi:uncharacterized membrane protein
MDPTLLVLRWAHVLAAIVAMGGLVFARFALLPALAELDADTRDRVHDRIRRAWLPWVIGAITLLLASGLANFLLFNARVKAEGWGGGTWMRETAYHSLFGAKFLMALVVFYFASALVGRGAGTQWVRNDRAKWLSVTVGLTLAIVLLSGWMRQLHTGPNIGLGADGGVMIERASRGTRPADAEEADGQEGQEAAGSAPAEDREAPAAAGGGEEAAR